ncbi:MAG: arylsulfatase [Candidatus Latescibacteria bacterium]|nr:arylsulfatase [Candidatus Latescibacterota bacterium]
MSDSPDRPNIVIMYADDLGFGDVSSYGATHIETPNIDRLAFEGLKFHDGYATAATCTPSRYSLLTGSYSFRNSQAHILPGDAPLIISKDEPTIPSVLKQAGYTTGVVGKWHLGIGDEKGTQDWNQPLPMTPLDIGFDYSYIMAATNDRVPCVYLDGRHVVDLDPNDPIEVTYGGENPYPDKPTGKDHPELLKMMYTHGHAHTIVNGVSRIGYMKGGEAALWTDEDMADIFVEKAISFATENKDNPFFLYYAFHQPHVPRLPNPRFVGKTKLGPRGDAIAEMDWCVGQFLNALERLGLKENTIVIFSSDNGPVLNDGYADQAVDLCGDHRPAGPLRGGKYSMLDGGTRVPFILSYPNTVEPGETSALVSHADFLASFASLAGVSLEPEAGPDSENILSALLGQSAEGRTELVTEGVRAKTVFRRGDWVYIPPHEGPAVQQNVNIETGNSPDPQLYNLSLDIGQATDQAAKHPDKVNEMAARLQEIRDGEKTRV